MLEVIKSFKNAIFYPNYMLTKENFEPINLTKNKALTNGSF